MPIRRDASALCTGAFLSLLAHCSPGNNTATDAMADRTTEEAGDGTAMRPDGDAGTSSLPDATGDDSGRSDSGGLGPRSFRRGVNGGYHGPGIDRREAAQISVRAGANSIRTTLPEYYLEMWGERIEVDDYTWYAANGIDQLACFLIGPTTAHSSAPAGTPAYELDHYAPRNLYEPIFLADGSVNPNNYWAAYVERVARTYGNHVDIYEVWNEPDQVGGNWQATEMWNTRPPTPAELIWWHDTIFAYVRALRITHEVVQRLDPTGQVTLGGVGYPNFLRAVLRYTDEPTAGRVSAEYPHTGGSYLDVVSYHYYPIFGGGSSDRGVEGFITQRNDLRTALHEVGIDNLNYVVTENGAPRYALGTNPGGVDYSANFLLKSMALAHYEGFVGVDWFGLGDSAAIGASMDPFAYMGMYFDYGSANTPAEVRIAPQGEAYTWLATWIEGTAANTAALTALALPADVRGAAFTSSEGAHRYVLWAHTMTHESATAAYALHASGPVRVRTWSPSGGEHSEMRTPAGGIVMLALTGTPQVIDVP